MTHTFQFDPNSILGVASGASLREIRDAYHQKSLKHHPDKGGDEWAFRMVARAYEILTTARVVNRAGVSPPAASRPTPRPEPPPAPRASWTSRFHSGSDSAESSASKAAPESASPTSNGSHPRSGAEAGSTGPVGDSGSSEREATNLSGWGGMARPHVNQSPAELARIVAIELLILRFELECSLDLFTRNPEDRNLSCTLHITWPLAELAESKEPIADASKRLSAIGEAFKARGVRKHALTKRSQVEGSRFVGWLTYPTAVMASEALEAFREALVAHGMTIEKQVREMALPRQW